jgi:hypothetical protein
MPLTITRRAKARITAHGLNVYPLEGFGLLLGPESIDPGQSHVLAALPVGKTERWYEPTGRFARVSEALEAASNLFAAWHLHPLGLYCTVYESFGPYPDGLLATAPHLPEAPWLILRSVDGGESIFGCWAKLWEADQWRDEPLTVVSPRIEAPERNPHRIASAWNRTWGVLDYSNLHQAELLRLGLKDRAS